MVVASFNQEKALVRRGLLRDCETLNFAKVRLQLYFPHVPVSRPGASTATPLHSHLSYLQVRTQHLDEDELAAAPRAGGHGVGVGQLGDGAVVEPPGGAARLEARGALEGAGHQEAASGEEELGRGGRRH